LKIDIAAQFEFNGKQNLTFNLLPNATKSDEVCGEEEDELKLKWEWQGATYQLSFSFSKNKTEETYKLHNLTLEDTSSQQKSYLVGPKVVLSGGLGKSYKCNHQEKLEMSSGSVTWKDVQVQAFMNADSDGKYGTQQVCAEDDTTSDVVPIAVGCALIALVIIVLIAYIVGRKISRQKGYQSV
jgi:lysosomal-associated membrane protein 1/2